MEGQLEQSKKLDIEVNNTTSDMQELSVVKNIGCSLDPKIINLSNYKLSSEEIKLLKKGLKFTPTPSANADLLKSEMKNFSRKIKLMEYFSDLETKENTEFTNLVSNKSNFMPISKNKNVEDFIEQITSQSVPHGKHIYHNLTKLEREAIETLRNNPNIIIKEADKGGTLVVMNKEFYYKKIIDMLHNEEYYEPSDKDCESKILRKIKSLVNNHNNELSKKELDYIINFETISAHFYGLPKIHKSKLIQDEIKKQKSEYIELLDPEDLSFRPIVGGPESPTQRLSRLLDILLKPLCQQVKSYVRDDIDFLNHLPESVDPNSLLATFDVINLYSNIDKNVGLEAVKYWLNKHPDIVLNRFTNDFILNALDIVVSNNVFEFNNQYYTQKKGVAMGTRVAPVYATLTLGYLEEKLFEIVKREDGEEAETYLKLNFKRYLDDCFIVWDKSKKDLEKLHSRLNSLDKSLQFTCENSYTTLPFLDVLVKKQGCKIDTDIYYKPTDSHQYLNFKSCHPSHTKRNIPYSLARRICTIVSEHNTKLKRLHELSIFLAKQGYPEGLIKDSINKVKCIPQKDLRITKHKIDTENDILTIVTTFNPHHPNSIHTVKNNLHIIERSSTMKRLLSKTDIINSRKQPKNLKRLLTTSKFEKNTTLPQITKCGDKRCKLCSILIEGTHIILNNSEKFTVKQNMNCKTQNLVYMIICDGCKNTYIGETEQQLNQRINLHRSQIKNPNNRTIPLSKHLHQCGKGVFKVFPLLKLFSRDQTLRRIKETRLINKYNPKLNSKI